MANEEVDLNAEEMEEVIAPGGGYVAPNHNETLQQDGGVELNAEEMEEVIAPGSGYTYPNHNETLAEV